MKKKMLPLLAIVLLLTGCSQAQLNDTNVEIAESAVNTIDDYLDGDIDASAAVSTLSQQFYKIDENDAACYLNLRLAMLSARIKISSIDYYGRSDASGIIEQRNRIAGLAGLKERTII